MADGKVPESLRKRIFREEGYTCAVCGLYGWPEKRTRQGYGYPTPIFGVYLSIDHIVPVSRGGTNSRDNLRVFCTACNTTKGTKLLSEIVEGKRGSDA